MAQKKTSKTILARLWGFLFKPTRPVSIYTDPKQKKRSTKAKPPVKRGGIKAVPATVKTDAPADNPANPAHWGHVDSKGNVRLKGSDRILGRSSRSKKAALQEFADVYAERAAALSEFEQKGRAVVNQQSNWKSLSELDQLIRKSPGLGDVQTLEQRLSALKSTFDEGASELLAQREEHLSKLDALSRDSSNRDVQGDLSVLQHAWDQIVVTGRPQESPLMLKFDRSLKALRAQEQELSGDTDALDDEAEALIERLEDTIERSEWGRAKSLMLKNGQRLALLSRALGPDLKARLTMIEQVVQRNADAEAEEAASLQVEADANRQAVLDALQDLIDDEKTDGLGKRFGALERNWHIIRRREKLGNPAQELAYVSLAAKVQDRITNQRQKVAESREAEAAKRLELLKRVETALGQLEASEVNWKATDKALKTIKADWKALPFIPKEQKAQFGTLMDRFQALSQDHFDKLGENKELAGEKKRVLISELVKFPASWSSKQLREHLSSSLEAWKAAGSAGHDHEQALWDEYQGQRTIVRAEIDRLRSIEAGERSSRLSKVFADKRAFQHKLEGSLMVDEMMQADTPSGGLAKQIKKKKKQISALQDQCMQIQKNLRQLDKLKQKQEDQTDAQVEQALDASAELAISAQAELVQVQEAATDEADEAEVILTQSQASLHKEHSRLQ